MRLDFHGWPFQRGFPLFPLLAVIIALLSNTVARGEQPERTRPDMEALPPKGSPPTFLISHWSFPKDEARLLQFSKAGFNTVIATPEEMPYCRRFGWRALLAAPPEEARKFANDPLVWGYFVFDEPARKKVAYDSLAKKMEAYHALDASRPAYINLNEKDDPEAFIKILKPRILSYDYYQWWAGPEPFFPLLEKFRRAALGANIPLICWVEAVATPNGPLPADNAARIRHSVYSALAYGAQGIQWWAWRAENRDAQSINEELKVLGPVLMALRSVDVVHTAPLPPGTRALPEHSWVKSATDSLTIGLFKNEQGTDFILAANRDWKAPRTAVLTFTTPVSTVSMLDRKTGKWVDLQLASAHGGPTISHTLPPGDGVLLRVTGPRK